MVKKNLLAVAPRQADKYYVCFKKSEKNFRKRVLQFFENAHGLCNSKDDEVAHQTKKNGWRLELIF